MARPTTPLLELSIETAPRDVVRIDGKDYVLRRSDDLTIDTSQKLGARLRELAQIAVLRQRQGKVSRKVERRLGVLLEEVCRDILAAPQAVQKRLTPVMRFRIANVFQVRSLLGHKAAQTVAASGQPKALNRIIEREGRRLAAAGKTSSRGLSGSTAAISSRGGRSTPSD